MAMPKKGPTKAELAVDAANAGVVDEDAGSTPMSDDATAAEPPAKASPKKKKKKKAGRPKGSPTKKKAPPMQKQKAAKDIVDLDQRMIASHKAINEERREYNKRHGTNMPMLPEKMSEITKPEVDLPDGAVAGIIMATGEVLGEVLDVEARPSQESLDAADKAWQPVIKIFLKDPTFLLIGAAAGATAACYAPMVKERQRIKKGELEPASKRKKLKSVPEPPAVDPDA